MTANRVLAIRVLAVRIVAAALIGVTAMSAPESAAARPPYAIGADPREARAPIAHNPSKPAARPGNSRPAQNGALVARPAASADLAGEGLFETVQPGDTLYAVSRRRRVPLRALIEANALEPPFALTAGERLRIPPPRRHRVAAGETLYSLAQRFNVDFRSLALMNGLAKPYAVAPGDRLILPALARDNDSSAAEGTDASEPEAPSAPHSGPIAAPPPAGMSFVWPVAGPIARQFGAQPGGQRLDGVEWMLPDGTSVRAAAAGEIVYEGEDLPGYGRLMLIRHAGGWVTAYAHLASFGEAEGTMVARGAIIARAGNAPAPPSQGSPGEATLHFEIRNPRGRPVDPRQAIGAP